MNKYKRNTEHDITTMLKLCTLNSNDFFFEGKNQTWITSCGHNHLIDQHVLLKSL